MAKVSASESKITVVTAPSKCKPFLLRVMIFSPESGFKFSIEVQKACTAQNEEVWKLLFDLFKKVDGEFVQVVSVEFVAGDPNDIDRVATITDEGMTKGQVRAFRDDVYPLVKPFSNSGQKPDANDQKKIDEAMKKAVNAS